MRPIYDMGRDEWPMYDISGKATANTLDRLGKLFSLWQAIYPILVCYVHPCQLPSFLVGNSQLYAKRIWRYYSNSGLCSLLAGIVNNLGRERWPHQLVVLRPAAAFRPFSGPKRGTERTLFSPSPLPPLTLRNQFWHHLSVDRAG